MFFLLMIAPILWYFCLKLLNSRLLFLFKHNRWLSLSNNLLILSLLFIAFQYPWLKSIAFLNRLHWLIILKKFHFLKLEFLLFIVLFIDYSTKLSFFNWIKVHLWLSPWLLMLLSLFFFISKFIMRCILLLLKDWRSFNFRDWLLLWIRLIVIDCLNSYSWWRYLYTFKMVWWLVLLIITIYLIQLLFFHLIPLNYIFKVWIFK
jgi:hypothetical protein